MIKIVNGPLRSGTYFYTRAVAARENLPILNFNLYYGPPDTEMKRIAERGLPKAFPYDWDRVFRYHGVVHAHLGFDAFVGVGEEITDHVECIVRNPRNSLVSAMKAFNRPSLVDMLDHKLYGLRPYVGWQKAVSVACHTLGFVRYEDLTKDVDEFFESSTNWRDHWSDAVEEAWASAGMGEVEKLLDYDNSWKGT